MLGMSPVDCERMLAMSAIVCPFSKHQSASVGVHAVSDVEEKELTDFENNA